MGNPLPVNLAQECRKAQKILTEFVDPAHGSLDRMIPISVLRRAQGFAIFTVARLGFLVSARAGSGVVIARLPDGSWSAPSALGLGGLGGGFNAGVDVTDFLIVLNSKQAVRSYMATGSLQLGGNLSVAVGPLGRAAEASGALNSSGQLAAIYSYSKSKGLYGGVSVEGTILVDRSDANSKAYNQNVTAKQLLSGSMEAPSFAQPLIATIERFTGTGNVEANADSYAGEADRWMKGSPQTDPMDSLDRNMQAVRVSSPSTSRQDGRGGGFVDDYESHRPGEYAFGSTSGGSHTNSPTRTRKSFLGNHSTSKGTDYQLDSGERIYDEPPSPTSTRTRVPFRRNRSSTNSGSIFGDDGGTYASSGVRPRRDAPTPPLAFGDAGARPTRSHRATSSFPTRFQNDDDDDDEDDDVDARHEPRNEPIRSARDSWDDDVLVSQPNAAFTRAAGNDLLDFELDRGAVTQRQAPRATEVGATRERDLIDFGDTGGSRRTGSGMDELDKELQARSSMSSLESPYDSLPPMQGGGGRTSSATGWRSDFGPAAASSSSSSSRPKIHARTSSTQKIMNRLRGNSQSSKSALYAESWDQRYSSPPPASSTSYRTSPSPDLLGSTTPPAWKSTTPTPSQMLGVRSSTSASSSQVVASFNFEGQEQDDLSFKRGDVIDVLKRTANRDDWWLGRSGIRTGNFPANYTEDV